MNTHLIHGQQDGFVDWPYKVRSRVVSPSKWLRSSGQRLLLLTDHQRGQVFDQHALPVRTSHLHPFLRNWMRDKASEGWLQPLLMQKREASAVPARTYHFAGERSMSRSSHIPSTGKPVATHAHKRKSSTDTRSVQETHVTSARIRTEQQEWRSLQIPNR